jgi:hypothetical protein
VDQTFAHYTSSSTSVASVGVGNCHDVEERVNEVLLMMGLEDVADTVIGKSVRMECSNGGTRCGRCCATQRWRAAAVSRQS